MLSIGTSGWHYDHWRGNFYPDDVKDMLGFYTSQFKSVEVNNTFYQLPEKSTFEAWYEATPHDFEFAVKASRYMTHMKKLKDPDEPIARFLGSVEPLGDKLGPVLFQLPGKWHFNAERLEQFLRRLPDDHRYAFEFRDKSWHTQQAYDLLAAYDAAFCVYEFAGYVSPKEVTADFVYIRLHGPNETPYEGEYGNPALSGWAGAISSWLRQGKDVYCFFDNDQAGYAPRDALRLKAMLDT
ncbi:DUF72 domain-containing protein [Phototrophicus methaneseepsis]|uniref:DUF72 domain-containing protein n=1 Tax=Phototrophicus methaneseepsis TaxID=2710758 RepID=A0A7S8E6L2_9CHLR|nr:DUF72 domain-containing protein [Phototrophicus methaneseepsis]QPC81310.1 DUF72 domain-containing protein [Phototrophicus methaneseepsis]